MTYVWINSNRLKICCCCY